MLPFPTYTIPEALPDKTEAADRWLYIFHSEPLTPEKNELLRKIASAVRADFGSDVYCKMIRPDDHFTLGMPPGQLPKLVISFGVEPSRIGYWIDLPAPGIRFLVTSTFILTVSLSALEKNALLKKSLWGDMQTYLEKH